MLYSAGIYVTDIHMYRTHKQLSRALSTLHLRVQGVSGGLALHST